MLLRQKINLTVVFTLIIIGALMLGLGGLVTKELILRTEATLFEGILKNVNADIDKAIAEIKDAQLLEGIGLGNVQSFVLREKQTAIVEYLHQYRIRNTGHFTVIDGNGMVLFRPIQALESPFRPTFLKTMRTNNSGTLRYNDKGVPLLVSFTHAKEWDWLNILSVDEKELFGEAKYFLWVSLGITVGLILVVYLSFQLMLRGTNRRIDDTLSYLRNTTSGNYETHISIKQNDEIGQIQQGLNTMVDAVVDHTGQLRDAKNVAEEANAAKSEFLSSMSHELRTPLNAILGFGQMLDDPANPLNKDQRLAMGHILDGGDHLLNLINEVLELAKIESGQLSMSIEPVAINTIVAPCILAAESLGTRFGISIENRISDADTTAIMADVTRCKQVLLNLISNAVKYNKPGGSVILDCTMTENKTLRFTVTDTGQGIAEKDFDKLFSPFERLSNVSGEIEGAGIGLTITKELVEYMGGEIGVTSTVGEGSTFWVDIPYAGDDVVEVDKIRARVSAHEVVATATESLNAPKSIYYIEDNPANVNLMNLIIKKAPNLTLSTAETAEEGLAAINKNPPDLILMDVNLPGMSGIEATRNLKQNKATAHIPVIAVSANAMNRDLEKAEDAGFLRYIIKPFKVDDVMNGIAAAFGDVPPSIELSGKELSAISNSPAADPADVSGILSASAVEVIQNTRAVLSDPYVDTLKNMFVTIPQLHEEMTSAIGEGDTEKVERLAHRIKSNSATLGAIELSEFARTAEYSAANDKMGELPDLLVEMDKEYARVTPAIEKLLNF